MNPEIDKLFRTNNPKDLHVFSKSFADSAWLSFNFHAVMEVLLSEKNSYQFHKEILFEALCGWMIAPHLPKVRRDAICMKVRMKMSAQEARVIKTEGKNLHIEDISMRIYRLGAPFINQIYYPIGGIGSLSADTRPMIKKRDQLNRDYRPAVDSLNKMIEIMHFDCAQNRDPTRYNSASLRRCYSVIEEINAEAARQSKSVGEKVKAYRTQKSIESYSRKYKGVQILTYAAQFTRLNTRGATLLDRSFGRRVIYNESSLRDQLRYWLSVAAYIRNEIVVASYRDSLDSIVNFESLNVAPMKILPKDIPEWQADIIAKKMDRSAVFIPSHMA